MTSVIVPPVDLAPGMPSRVVSISATDVTEGGTSLAGQMVRFALSDSLDVTSGGDVIAKSRAEVVLDSQGNGSIRLPVYNDAVKTWCGDPDWAIIVTTTWGSQKAIRVPAGTTPIALSALPPVRPLRGREKQWAVTGVSLTVTSSTTGQATGTATLAGGVLNLGLTLPTAAPHEHGQIENGSGRYSMTSAGGTQQVVGTTEVWATNASGRLTVGDVPAERVSGLPGAIDPIVSSRVGSRTIALDTDGTPYWAPSGGSAYLLYDLDGRPYWQATLPSTAQEDADGTPYLVSPPTLPAPADVAWDEVTGKPTTYPPSSHTHSEYVTMEALEAELAALPAPDVLAGPGVPPAWSGGVTSRSWDPSLHLYNGESPALDGLRGIVRDGGHLVYIGDSKTQGQGGDPLGKERESLPAVLARYAGARPGCVFLNLALQWESWWTVKGFTFTPSLHATWQTGHSTYWVRLDAPTEHTALTWWARALDAPATVTPSVDGTAGTPVSIPQGTKWTATRIEHASEGAHVYQWDTTDHVQFLGVAYEYATPGLTVTNAGRAGAGAGAGDYGWRQSTDPGSLWHEGVALAAPDGIVVQLGTNATTTTLTPLYGEVAAVAVPWAIVAPGSTPDTTDRLARVAEAYSLADSLDAPLIDHRHLLGNQAQAATRGLTEPGTTPHENARGYRLEGSLHRRILS